MSKQNKNRHTGLFICAGTIVVVSMAAALLFLRWALNTDPANAPSAVVTGLVMILPVIVMFILFVVLMKLLWPTKPVSRKNDIETEGDTSCE